MGGRGAGYSGGGGTPITVKSTRNLISERERQQTEVDLTLSVLRDVEKEFNVIINDAQIVTLGSGARSVLAYYDSATGDLAVNKNFFDAQKMDGVYDVCVQSGFHPSRGNKTGMEAVIAHEMGHRINDMAASRAGQAMDGVASTIHNNAAKSLGITAKELSSRISGYAQKNSKETIAEAYSDVYCNGDNAKAESKAIVNELKKYF